MSRQLFHKSLDVSLILAPVEALREKLALATNTHTAIWKDLHDELFAERRHAQRRRRFKGIVLSFRIPSHTRQSATDRSLQVGSRRNFGKGRLVVRRESK